MDSQKFNAIKGGNKQAPLWSWTAEELAYGIRTKLISSREAVSSCLERIQEINSKINAIVELRAEEALQAAEKADEALAKGENIGPLHGVPIATKINSDQAGYATTDGVVAFKDNVAVEDSPHILNLRQAGAIFLGRTNVPAFSLRWFSNNDLYGYTLNPWDEKRTPGGSSGGAAAAVATGMVPIAHGNDIAGSIRYPAYACGVTGIRPTVGRVPSWHGPVDADQSLATQLFVAQGPLARRVADLRLALSAMSSYDPRDPVHASVPLKGEPLKRPIRVGLFRGTEIAKPDAMVNQALDLAAKYLGNAGYIVEEVDLPLFAEAHKLWFLLVLEDLRGMMPMIEQLGDHKTKLNLQYNYKIYEEIWGTPDLETFKQGYARRGTLIKQLQQCLEEYPLLLMPVSAEVAFIQDEDIKSLDSNRRLMTVQWPMMSIPILGVPALSVPVSVINGLPVGVQLVGKRFREDTLFEAGEIIEAQARISTPIDPMF